MDTEEDGSWLSYAELADTRGIDRQSARRLASRQKLRRQKDNTGLVRVLVPDRPQAITVRARRPHALSADTTADKPSVSADMSIVIKPLEAAIDALREQLEREQGRADRAEAEAAALRQADTERRTGGRLSRLLAAWRGR